MTILHFSRYFLKSIYLVIIYFLREFSFFIVQTLQSDLTALFCVHQVRLVRGDFTVNPRSVYKTHEELWDGEI